jgi:hypothetical protein
MSSKALPSVESPKGKIGSCLQTERGFAFNERRK